MVIRIVQLDTPSNTRRDEYIVTFFEDQIFTTVTRDPARVSRWITDILHVHRQHLPRLIVGFDIKYRIDSPSASTVAVLQLCVGSHCLIYQLMHTDNIPRSLRRFLSHPANTFVGVNIVYHMSKLREDWGLGANVFVVELGFLAGLRSRDKTFSVLTHLMYAPLERLARIVLKKSDLVGKPLHVMLSNWENQSLTYEQMMWACVDARISFQLGKTLKASVWRFSQV